MQPSQRTRRLKGVTSMRIADWLAKPTVEKMSAKRDIPGLVKATRHKDPAVRADAAWALSRMGSAQGYAAIAALEKEGADQLLAAYQKADGHAQIAVASALVHLGGL